MCINCGRVVFDPEDLINGLCTVCVDQLLFGKKTVNDDVLDSKGRMKKFSSRATRKSAESSLMYGRTVAR